MIKTRYGAVVVVSFFLFIDGGLGLLIVRSFESLKF